MSELTYMQIVSPSVLAQLRFYMGGLLPEHYRAWVEQEVEAPDHTFRAFLCRLPMGLACFFIALLVGGRGGSTFLTIAGPIMVGIAAVASYAMRDLDRIRTLTRHRAFWNER
ncbi:MAG: hypothetical protein QOG04_2191 [Actinomycetota bacterium]|jgi:hypothetical protein|nr:hypothetical protein [Actinomycetota bacterium]